MTDKGMNTLASRGLEEPFFQMWSCVVSVFWFWQKMRELALHYFLADCFEIEREIVFGVTYILSVQYSCAVVSVFFCGGKVKFVRIPYSHDCVSKILRTFFVKKMIHIKLTSKKTNSFLFCMYLQPYSHYCFSKISRILFDFLNNTYWISLF